VLLIIAMGEYWRIVPLRVSGHLRLGYCRGLVLRLRRLGRAGGFPSWLLVGWNPGTILQGPRSVLDLLQ
jgi:hypothetical protein